MTHWRQMMDRPTLGAWDFYDENGKSMERIARIKAVNEVKLEGIPGKIAANRKPVLTLEDSQGNEWDRKLICGVMICEAIASMYGSDVRQWPGKLITMYPDVTKGQRGGKVDCVRVKNVRPNPGAKTSKAPTGPVDEKMRQKQIDEASAPPTREPGADDE